MPDSIGQADAALNAPVRRRHVGAVIQPDGQQKILQDVPPPLSRCSICRGRPEAAVELEVLRTWLSHLVLAADRWPVRPSRDGPSWGGSGFMSALTPVADLRSIYILLV
jgi:hypothetical protein